MSAAIAPGPFHRLLPPALVLAVAAAGVLWAWPQDFGGWRRAGIALGWAGTGALVASLILMIRQPRLAVWLGGLDHMYRWHHRSGTVAYVLLAAHPLALAVGGWSESPQVAWATISPGAAGLAVLLGWASLVLLMFGLATTFSLRLAYRRWRGFHYVLAVAVVAGLGHVYLLLVDALPLLLLAVLATAALGWRLLGSDLGLEALPYRVTAVDHPTADVVEATLAPCATPMRVRPGQFVLAAFEEGQHFHGCGEFHPFTVSAIAPDHALRIGIKALGVCTRNVQHLEPGVLVRLQGPFGDFLDQGHGARPPLWVAGGIGVTPFVAALRSGAVPDGTVLAYLYRREDDAPFLAELRQIAAERATPILLTDASGTGPPDLDRVLAQVPDIARRQVLICGPGPLVERLRPRLQALGVPSDHIHHESFDFR